MGGTLVGREGELARVRAWLVQRTTLNRAGQTGEAAPPLALVSGEAGAGKTALVDAALEALDQATRTVRLAAAPWAGCPELLPRLRAALEHPGPLVVLLDDLHWAGADVLDRLPALAQRAMDRPLAVVGCYRAGALGRTDALRAVRADLRHGGLVTESHLGPLTREATRSLVEQRLGPRPPDDVDALHHGTEGLPFLLVAVLDAVAAGSWSSGSPLPLPDTVRDVVARQVRSLPEVVQQAIRLAAVAGPTVDERLLAAVADDGWPEDLEAGEILGTAPDGRLSFRHELARRALVEQVPPAARRTWQRELAAGHLRSGAPRDALRLLGPLAEGWPARDAGVRRELLGHLATAAESCGEHEVAAWALADLLPAEPGPDDTDLLARLATQHELQGRWAPAVAERERAARVHDRAGRPAEAAVQRLAVAVHLRSAASLRAALEVTATALRDARAAGRPDLVCRAEALHGNLLARSGRGADGVAEVRGALHDALAAGLEGAAADAYQRLADALEHTGDYRSAASAYDAAYAFCRQGDQEAVAMVCQACASVVMLHSGRWDTALEVGAEVARDPGSPPNARAVAEVVTGLVGLLRGRRDGPRAALLGARASAAHLDLVPVELLATWGLALHDVATGDEPAALAGLRRVLELVETTEERHYCVPVLQDAAVLLGRHRRAHDLARVTTLLREADRGQQPDSRIALAVALAEHAVLDGRPAAAVAHLRRALATCAEADLPLAEIGVRRRLAQLLAGTDREGADRDEAVELLRSARRTARRLRARLLLDPVEADLAALGEPPPTAGTARADRGGIDLTAREREVLTLVGEGLTSREAAARLFLSVRTVEMHVRHAMAKLDCRTRTEAALRLAREDGALGTTGAPTTR